MDDRAWYLRERISAVLEQAAAGVADPEDAAQLLAELREVWTRERRWRNATAPDSRRVVHVAGPIIACREARRSCPGYIVDRRQTCEVCGLQLVRGRWAMFFEQGDLVAQLGTIFYPAKHVEGETPCGDWEVSPA